jgi:hypothetical protein
VFFHHLDLSHSTIQVRSRISWSAQYYTHGYGRYLISIYIADGKKDAQEAGATSSEELLEDISSSADEISRIGLHNTLFLQGYAYGPYLISIHIAGEKQNAKEAGASSSVKLLEDISSSANGTLSPGSYPNRIVLAPVRAPPYSINEQLTPR